MDKTENHEKQIPRVEMIQKQESFTSLRNIGSILGIGKQPSDRVKSLDSLTSLS